MGINNNKSKFFKQTEDEKILELFEIYQYDWKTISDHMKGKNPD